MTYVHLNPIGYRFKLASDGVTSNAIEKIAGLRGRWNNSHGPADLEERGVEARA